MVRRGSAAWPRRRLLETRLTEWVPVPAVRKHGVEQFLNLYHAVKSRREDTLRWGDEVCRPRWARRLRWQALILPPQLEYHVVRLDGAARAPKLLIRAPEILKALKEDPESAESCVAQAPRPPTLPALTRHYPAPRFAQQRDMAPRVRCLDD